MQITTICNNIIADCNIGDVVLLKERLRGKGPKYVFSDAGVEVTLIEATSLDEVLAQL